MRDSPVAGPAGDRQLHALLGEPYHFWVSSGLNRSPDFGSVRCQFFNAGAYRSMVQEGGGKRRLVIRATARHARSLCKASELWPQDEGHKGNRGSRNQLTHVKQHSEISNKANGPANACARENCDRHQTYKRDKPPMLRS